MKPGRVVLLALGLAGAPSSTACVDLGDAGPAGDGGQPVGYRLAEVEKEALGEPTQPDSFRSADLLYDAAGHLRFVLVRRGEGLDVSRELFWERGQLSRVEEFTGSSSLFRSYELEYEDGALVHMTRPGGGCDIHTAGPGPGEVREVSCGDEDNPYRVDTDRYTYEEGRLVHLDRGREDYEERVLYGEDGLPSGVDVVTTWSVDEIDTETEITPLVRFTYEDGRLAHAESEEANIDYSYDERGLLVRMRSETVEWRFAYEEGEAVGFSFRPPSPTRRNVGDVGSALFDMTGRAQPLLDVFSSRSPLPELADPW